LAVRRSRPRRECKSMTVWAPWHRPEPEGLEYRHLHVLVHVILALSLRIVYADVLQLLLLTGLMPVVISSTVNQRIKKNIKEGVITVAIC